MQTSTTRTQSKIARGIILTLVLSAALALSGCTGARPVAEVIGADLEARGFVDSADGGLRISGQGGLLLSLARQANPPPAPAGWELVGPVFDVTAQDRQRRPVQQLASRLMLRFNVKGDRPLTVLAHDGQGWQVVESELDDDGLLTASVDHLTPYTVGAPKGSGPGQSTTGGRAAPAATRAAPAATRPAPAATRTLPTGTRAIPTVIASQTQVTTAVTPVSAADAQAALANAIKPLKGKSVRVSQAAGYTGNLYVTLPPEIQGALGEALSAGGSGYYGLYNAVNEAVTMQAAGSSGSASGAFTLLIEPRTGMPASADAVQAQLKALFPGVTVPLTEVPVAWSDNVTGYVFYGVSGNTAYSLGYITYSGIPLAYAAVGSGSYSAFVPR
jgi:hypothetical protein